LQRAVDLGRDSGDAAGVLMSAAQLLLSVLGNKEIRPSKPSP